MGEGKGWICLHRSIQTHDLWQDKPFSKGQAWIDLIMLANHEEKRFMLGNEFVRVKRGSLITSELKLMERWGWSKAKVRNFLHLLESDSMIDRKTDKKKTTITLVNYSVFQDMQTTERPKKDHKKTTKKPQKDTNNNDNNDNNDNKESREQSSRFKPPTIEEVKAYCLERNNSVNPQRFIDYYSSIGWLVGKDKKPMKDWKAAVRNWESWEDNKKGDKNNVDQSQRNEYYSTTDIYGYN